MQCFVKVQQYPHTGSVCRNALKTLNRQFQLASKNRTACSNNLVALLEQTSRESAPIFPALRVRMAAKKGPQLMAEIGDIRRFAHQKSLVSFADTDPGKDDSGDVTKKHNRTSKRGSPYLRKTLFIIMDILIQLQPQDDPVYQFLDKKRAEGKPYYVYMTAGGTKFLRIYYGKVRDALIAQGLWNRPVFEQTPSD